MIVVTDFGDDFGLELGRDPPDPGRSEGLLAAQDEELADSSNCHVPLSPCRSDFNMRRSILLVSLLLAALMISASATTPRRMLLDACEDKCDQEYENNVRRCIAETKLGTPPEIKKEDQGMMTKAYVPPTDTSFQLAEQKCRELQQPDRDACKAKCKPANVDCGKVATECDDSFTKGTLLAAWCRQSKGC